MDKQQEFVLRTLEERDIRFVRLWFTDVLGFLKSVAVAPAELEGAFDEGIGFDGSAIEGFARVYESDMLARPDPGTFQILPWRSETPGDRADVLRHPAARRHAVVRRPAARAQADAGARPADLGFAFYTHPEIEFFLFRDQPSGGQAPVPVDQGGYFDHIAHGVGHDFRRDAITMLESMGISVEFSHHEGAPGQQEIDLRYADALSTADNIMTFRLVMKQVALSQGVYASFMPKPFTEHPGSGMHTHLSLFEGERNAFFEAGCPVPAVQGRPRRSSPGCCATPPRSPRSPTSGSTPTSGCSAAARRRRTSAGGTTTARRWSGCRCTSRARASRPGSSCARRTRACNPYLAFAVMLAAGLKGIEEGYELPDGAEDDVWALTDGERQRAGHRAAAAQPVRGDPA